MRPKGHRGEHSQLYSMHRSKAALLYPKLVTISQSLQLPSNISTSLHSSKTRLFSERLATLKRDQCFSPVLIQSARKPGRWLLQFIFAEQRNHNRHNWPSSSGGRSTEILCVEKVATSQCRNEKSCFESGAFLLLSLLLYCFFFMKPV